MPSTVVKQPAREDGRAHASFSVARAWVVVVVIVVVAVVVGYCSNNRLPHMGWEGDCR